MLEGEMEEAEAEKRFLLRERGLGGRTKGLRMVEGKKRVNGGLARRGMRG